MCVTLELFSHNTHYAILFIKESSSFLKLDTGFTSLFQSVPQGGCSDDCKLSSYIQTNFINTHVFTHVLPM